MFIFIHQVVGGVVLGRRENGRAKKKMVMNTKEKEEKRAARQCKQKRHTHISTTLTCFPFSTTMYRRRLTPSSHYRRRRRRLFPFFFNSAGMNPKIPKFRDSPIEPSKFTDNPNEITAGALNEGAVSKL
jgi:hypothetical protein